MDEDAQPTGPLAGVRVLDLTSVVMGPYATQLLGDLGADVITVEPGRGETNRAMGPGPSRQFSGVSLNLLRNKRNIAVNIKHPDGRKVILDLAATCDVFVTNLRPGPLARSGLTYDGVRAARPDIVYCNAQGYATGSQRQDEPAYDDIIQAETGVADAATRQGGAPQVVPTIMADKVCGLTIAYSIIAALYRRAITGEGDRVEVPMFDTVSAWILVEHGSAAITRPALGHAGYPRILTPNRRPWRTRDGWIMVLPYSRAHYDAIFNATGRTDLIGDERYATGRSRIANSGFLYEQVGRALPSRTTQEWLAFFRDHDIPAGAVGSLDDLVERLPESEHPHAGRYKVIPPPVRFEAAPQNVRRHAPRIGEHTEEVLLEIGYDQADVVALRASGALGTAPAEFA